MASKVSDANYYDGSESLLGHCSAIRIFVATIFDDLWARDKHIALSALLVRACTGLLGATLDDITLNWPGNTDSSMGSDEQGAAVVIAAETHRGQGTSVSNDWHYLAAIRRETGTAQKQNCPVRSGSKRELHLQLRIFEWVLDTAEPHFHELKTLVPIEHLCSDGIAIQYIRTLSSFWCCFSTLLQMCDPFYIHQVTVKDTQLSSLFKSDLTNIAWIGNWRLVGERAPNTSYFTARTHGDTIRTQKCNWSQGSEFAKEWNRPKKHMMMCSSVFSMSKIGCNCPGSVPTSTRHPSSRLEPLLPVRDT